jgi:hypothetical protein
VRFRSREKIRLLSGTNCDPQRCFATAGQVVVRESVKAPELIRSASYGPDTLNVLFKAFDDAWNEIRPSVSDDAMAVEAARLRLANILLSLAREDSRDFELLRDETLRTYRLMHKTPRRNRRSGRRLP